MTFLHRVRHIPFYSGVIVRSVGAATN